MSEDEETVCRLTYKEGMELAELAERPFTKAKRAVFWMAVIGFVGLAAMFAIDSAFPPEMSPEAIEAGFTAAQWDYIRKSVSGILYAGSMLGFMLSMLTVQVALTVLQSGIAKGWLKAANEERRR